MDKKNKLVELLEHEVRWYYRIPVLVAVVGVVFTIIALLKNDVFLLTIGGCFFFVGLGAQWVLGFNNFYWKRKK
ncbi:hypothetical protein JEA88_004882 [Salmonella enterica]|uniref:hypothetical protein n=1 Tax=Citrobacter amalonaticus TaxID=35703 RepID=UPI000A3651FF|nr:hypothetical protein [Citrobacter amalonaticus]EGU0213460.1 hypothetical protein [Salmonella enterica]EIS0947250.1 hypothetical protein [Salmonella enterica]OUE50099.1 hypothetical protein AZ012_004739 [Citrobacter amalonaticus]